MKTFILVCTLMCFSIVVNAQEKTVELIGKWKLDMSPHNSTDNNFAMMEITKVNGSEIYGTFYREGVRLKNGQINTQTGVIYAALMSEDNSGTYNSTFYMKDGKLYGTTHAVQRGFLSVWVAEKDD